MIGRPKGSKTIIKILCQKCRDNRFSQGLRDIYSKEIVCYCCKDVIVGYMKKPCDKCEV